nr:hypothetical protein [Tanacetum cinerariifolium]
EYLAPSDDEAPLEDQPLPTDTSPTAASSGYMTDSDPEEDPEDDFAPSAKEAEALEPDEPIHAPGSPISIPLSQTRLRRARKTVRLEPPMSASMEASIARQA